MAPSLTKTMRQDWDARARKNAFHYIASWRKEWDLESFLDSGDDDVERLVAPVLSRCGLPPAGKRMLELGCGAGRMTRSFARRFKQVYAFDLSRETIATGTIADSVHASGGQVLEISGENTPMAWCLGVKPLPGV